MQVLPRKSHRNDTARRRILEPIELDSPLYGGREPMLGALHAYWHAKSTGRTMPSRIDLDMVEMPRAALPYLMLIDVVRTGPAWRYRYRYRLVGTEMVSVIGRDVTSLFLDEVIPAERHADVFDWLDAVVRDRIPMALEMSLGWENRDFRHARRVALPLSADGTNVDMMLCAFALS